MTSPDSFSFRSNFSSEEEKEKALVTQYRDFLYQKQEELQKTLQAGLESFHEVDLAQAAREFRKLANDLKLLEKLATDKGNHTDRNTLNDLSGKQWIQHTKSWVVVDGRPGSITKEIKDHPASFPPSLAEFFISYFTKRGQWVMDPFMGIGSTVEACFTTRRNCFGTELNPKYCEFAQSRISKILQKDKKRKENIPKDLQWNVFNSDARNAISLWQEQNTPPIDFLITSPPYWNMLKKSRGGVKSALKQRVEEGLDEYYSESQNDYGNIDDLTGYLAQLTDLFKSFKPMLKPKAYLMVILQNCRPKDGEMRPIAWDFANYMKKHFILRQEFIWCQDQKFAGIWGYPTTYVSNVHHHYCLVFQNSR
ncbi:DNA methyltransferase [Candidatus Lokiarchaeum ossiferum]|uniref:DNA methyltransferase n=1 Tax=Candidatus Lokiarchaeum ossiferum TaxID=2951803 RepID=UPI00352E4B79